MKRYIKSDGSMYTTFIMLKRLQTQVVRELDAWNKLRDVTNAVFDSGRGLGVADPSDSFTNLILNYIDELAFTSDRELFLYRTDDTNWLNINKVGDILEITTLLQASLNSDLVIVENEGKVAQFMTIKVPTGTKLLCIGNANELQIDVVRRQKFKITSIEYLDGVPKYGVEIIE